MIIFTESTSLYFYSAVFQGNMALLALLGVFVIFKLQQISALIQEKDKIILDYIQHSFQVLVQEGKHLPPLPMNYKDSNDLKKALEDIVSSKSFNNTIRNRAENLLKEADLMKRFSEREELKELKDSIINRTIFPFILISLIIFLSLIFLPLSNTIHLYFGRYEIYPITALICLNVFSLIINGIYIFTLLKK